MVAYVVDAARAAADEVVVVSRGALAARLERVLSPEVRVLRDGSRVQSPIVGLATGARSVRAPYVAALACDLPLLRPEILVRLFSCAAGRDAAIPRWPNHQIEPLVAVYRRRALLAAARVAVRARTLANTDMINRLRDVRYVSMQTLRREDPGLRSFTNVNTPEDLSRAERL
jgi:molybdopterin-guanine dinucleotide biosynthesis protein A